MDQWLYCFYLFGSKRQVPAAFATRKADFRNVIGNVVYGYIPSLATTIMADVYSGLATQFPMLRTSFVLGDMPKLCHDLNRGAIEFIITLESSDISQYESLLISEGEFHLYRKKEEVGANPIAGVFVDMSNGIHVSEVLGAYPLRDTLGSWDVVAHFIDAGLGVGLLPDYLAEMRYQNLELIRTELPTLSYRIVAIYQRGTTLTRASKKIIDSMRDG